MNFIMLQYYAVGARQTVNKHGLPGFPPDCVTARSHTPIGTTLWNVCRLSPRGRAMSINVKRFSGEAFGVCDIQFDHP